MEIYSPRDHPLIATFENVSAIPPVARLSSTSHLRSFEEYTAMWKNSVEDPKGFWGKLANEEMHWFRSYDQVMQGSFSEGNVRWFTGGELNICYNCVDRHVDAGDGDKIALIWEEDEPGAVTRVTYKHLLSEVSRIANLLKSHNVRKGDTVCIYMGMSLYVVYAMLAVARIGAIHSVVFAGFSAEALKNRIQDCQSKVVLTADESLRGKKAVPLKKAVDEALLECPFVSTVLVWQRTKSHIHMKEGRDLFLLPEMEKQRPYCPVERMDSEDGLFILYTSGSTGKPKGILHTQAGFLLYVSLSVKYVFDLHHDDIYACVADVGWITGHSYVVYGPLSRGATTVLFESIPTYPDPGRYWDMVQRHKITLFYTAPTALRTLMKYGNDYPNKYDLSSLRVLGTVGEPINPEAWKWYYEVIGKSQCAVTDTYWQTETGGHIMTPIPGVTPLKPGSCTFPFFGINPVLIDPTSGHEIVGNDKKGVLCVSQPWPSMTRTVYGDHQRYLSTYFKPYPGYYFTGDSAYRDHDGFYWIIGRVDDVINVSGHRLGTAELESALTSHPSCAEAAVITIPHDIKGEAMCAFCILHASLGDMLAEDTEDSRQALAEIRSELRLQVRKVIGPIATPDYVFITNSLPKTRSGKIMRRLLRKIAAHEYDSLGDVSTIADPAVVDALVDVVKKQSQHH